MSVADPTRHATSSMSENAVIHRPLLCLLCLFVPLVAHGQEIHKCVTPDGIAYQSSPCGAGEAATTIAAKAAEAPRLRPAPECGARPSMTSWVPGRRTPLCVGMTDDEVLNLPGWGRPAKIVRTRELGAWEERWTYAARDAGSRQLQFVNGRLADVEAEPFGTGLGSIASLSSQ